MGQCAGGNMRKFAHSGSERYWKEPPDTEKLAHLSLNKLEFQGTLANFKIFNCDYPAISVKVEIKGVDTFILRPKKIKSDLTANWAFQHKFYFEMTEYELRKSFVDIYLFDEHQSLLGNVKVNLYLISSGPYHQNFGVELKKSPNTRIYFDLRISQIIEIQLNSIQAELDLFTKHPGQKFNYSIKAIVGHNTQHNISSPSYTVRVKLDNNQNSQNSDLPEVLTLKRKNTIKQAEKEIPAGKNLVWIKDGHLPMPSIVMKTLASQLHQCYFQLIFWKILDESESSSTAIQQIPQLFGECYVALHKIFDTEPTVTKNAEGQVIEVRTFQSEDKIWHHGKEKGKGFFKFEVRSDQYIKQMQVMVRTENGIVKYSPVFFSSKERSNSIEACKEINDLSQISEQIEQTAIQLDKVKSEDSPQPGIEIRRLKVSIEKLLQRLLEVLQKSSQASLNLYSYSSAEEMLRAQELFLSIGFKVMGYLQEEDVHINDYCWEILVALIRRGEFILAHMGFDAEEEAKIKANKIGKKLQRKIDVALTYHQFLAKLLRYAVDSLNLQGLELERSFAQIFCAYAYFRLPHFRNAMLEAITRPNDPDLPEWRNIEFSLQNDAEDYDQLRQQVNTFTALFDWANNFHKCIEHFEKHQIDTAQINQILMREDWKYRMSKRGITFFQFIKCWVEYVESIVVKSKDIQWKYFPGYNKLLKCFLAEMKKRPILEYPDILKTSLFKLLANQKLLNPIMVILFGKANIYEPLTVIRAIVFISEIFTVLSQKNKKIPATFNYNHFYQGIKVVLESDFSYAISKTIVMIYNYLPTFNLEFRRNISMYLLGRIFFKLFLHWSHNVRNVFYHLVMRIYQEAQKFDPHLSSSLNIFHEKINEEVRSRFEKLMMVLHEELNRKKEERKNETFKKLEKDLYKKLKRKMYERRRKKSSLHLSQMEFTGDYPSSPISEKIDSSKLFQQRFALDTPLQFRPHRTLSQVFKPSVKLTYKISTFEKQEEVKALNNKNAAGFKHKIYDNTQGQKIEMKYQLSDQFAQHDEIDFLIPELDRHLVEYIEVSLLHFEETKKLFTRNFNNKSWELPKIQMEMPLDSKEIRPDKIDDW